MPKVHCQGVVVHLQAMTLLLQLCHHLLQLLRLGFSTGQILDSVVLYGNGALEDTVVVLQLCQLASQAAWCQSILQPESMLLQKLAGRKCLIIEPMTDTKVSLQWHEHDRKSNLPVALTYAAQLAGMSARHSQLCFWHPPYPWLRPFAGQGSPPTPLVTWPLLQHLAVLPLAHWS